MKLKSIVLILALLVSSLALAMPKAKGQMPNQFFLDPTPKIGHVGTDVSIDVKVYPTGFEMNAYQFALVWNPAVLKYKSITWGWLEELPDYTTTKLTTLSTTGNRLDVFEGFDDVTKAKTGLYFPIGDFNFDGSVDSTDLGMMGSAWNSFTGDPNFNPVCDLYPDGGIDSSDLGILGSHWNESPTPGLSNPVVLATITWTVMAGGSTDLTFADYALWATGLVSQGCTALNGLFYTYEPYVDFKWTPQNSTTFDYTGPRAGEPITYDGSASHPVYPGDSIASYSWNLNGTPATGVTATGSFPTYSKQGHDIALTVTTTLGYSYTLHKTLTIDRDISIFSIWPSMEDLEGSIEYSFVSGKYVFVYVRYANIGTITEYTDNSFGDFPTGTRCQLYLIHSDGTEERLGGSSSAKAVRRYWNYTAGHTSLDRLYDWAPLVGTGLWVYWDTQGMAAENDLMFKANFTDTGTGNDPFAGDTDLSNNVLWFGPFNITAGYADDLRIEADYNYDNGYYQPKAPWGTNFNYGYGSEYLNPYTGQMNGFTPIAPGDSTTVWVDISNVGTNDETVTWHVEIGTTYIYTETDTMLAGTYNTYSFTWNVPTSYAGTYQLDVYIEPVSGETGRWATWDNNTPYNINTYGLHFPFAYDSWVIQVSFP